MPIRARLPDGRTITVPDDTTPEELDAIVNEMSAASPDAGGPPVSSVMDERGFVDRAVDFLPAIAGTVASLGGATKRTLPGMAISGAAGAAGELGRQGIRLAQGRGREVPDTLGAALMRAGTEGAVQSGAEVGGHYSAVHGP